ncbi:hypothetical protein ISCGN_017668 [Ixodes scapularis]
MSPSAGLRAKACRCYRVMRVPVSKGRDSSLQAMATGRFVTQHTISQEPLMAAEDTWNLAYPWNEDFHVAFVIIAFLVILMALSIFGISVGLWFMDPGRDSIIYRMTSQRMKKD